MFHKEIQFERKQFIILVDQKDKLRQVLSLARLLGYYIFQFFFWIISMDKRNKNSVLFSGQSTLSIYLYICLNLLFYFFLLNWC